MLLAQSGPGGIGSTDGASNLVLWLKGDAGVLSGGIPASNGQTVNTWQDQSGYGYHAVLGGGTPAFTASNASFGDFPTITFDEANSEWLYIEDDANQAPQLDNTSGLSVFYVFNADNGTGVRGHLSKRDDVGVSQSYVFWENNVVNVRTNNYSATGADIAGSTTYINSITFQNGDYNHWLNQTIGNSITGGTSSIGNNDSDLHIGTFNAADGREFDGNMAEIIIFRQFLTNAQRIVVESYLASKYGISIANDYWDQATYSAYTNEVAGIGQHTDGTIANSATSGSLAISGGDGRANGEWLFWGHDGGDFATYTTTDIVTGTTQQRLAREWVVNETGDLGNVTVSIAAASLPSTGFPSVAFYVLVDTDGDADFSNATAHAMTLNGSTYEVSLNLANGNRMAIAFEPPIPANVSGTLAFWFSSQVGVEHSGLAATDGQTVTIWQDLSSVNGDGQNGTSPIFYTSKTANFHPVVRFNRASSQYLQFGLSPFQNSDYTLLSVVRKNSATSPQYIIGSESTNADAFLLGYSSDTQLDARNSASDNVSTSISAYNSPVQGPTLTAVTYNSVDLAINHYRNGSSSGSTATTSDYTGIYTGNLGRGLNANYLDADVLEVIGFSSVLSPSDYQAIVSNLSLKYGITSGSNYVDESGAILWDATSNSGFPNDVVGIGYDVSFAFDTRISKSASDSVILATNSDFTSLNSDGSRSPLEDGQYAFVSNDGDAISKNQSFNGVANSRLDRTWRVREVNAPGAIFIAVPSSIDVNVMLVSTDPTFTMGVTQTPMSTSGSYVFANYDFSDGDYVTFVSDASQVWYSYISGNWTNPLCWTLDGAISALYVNPNSEIPSPGDSVVIRSGRTITMVGNDVKVTKVEISGILDLGSTSSHNLGYLEGSGKLRLSGSGGLDNYPTAIDSLFYDTNEGGTVELYGTGLTLNSSRQYNNLIVNTTSSTDLVIQSASSIQVYGDMTITNGTFQMNTTATSSLLWEVYGDLLVETSGRITVGTGNARHELNLYGDFTNLGVVKFTNRASQTTNSEATNGIIDVNFVSDIKDQTVSLQNTTDFYRIEINKGVDPTYTAYFTATHASYFRLLGAANYNHASVTQLNPAANENLNAVGLYYGTLSLGTNINVGALTTNGNYNISEGATLQLDGGSATISGNAIVPYGNVLVNSGTITAPVSSGITTRGNGTLIVNGGTVTMNQFRTSVLGSTNQGGFVQTGGIVNVTGGSTSTNYYLLNLTYSGNVFNMSGGTLNLSGANTKGLIFINSDVENISVTGGTVNLTSTNTNAGTITSRAPFYNLTLSKTSGTGGAFINSGGSSGPGGTDETIENLPLKILSNFSITNAGNTTTFNANSQDVEITGNLTIQSGASVNFNNMKLVFEGTGSSDISILLSSTLSLDTLEINKTNGQVDVNILNGQPTALLINDYLSVQNGNLDLGTYNITVNGDLLLQDTVGTSTTSGKLYLAGSTSQSITSTSGAIYDLELNNANGVSLTGGLGVLNTLQLNAGIFNIGTNKLTCGSEITTTGSFSNSLMIQTAGNASDGGLEYYFNGSITDPATILYPMGTNANSTVRYTPASMNLSSVVDDGYVAINLADTELLTTNLAGGNILSYYWRSRNRAFATAPKVNYTFTYATSDDGASDEANYVPGKVLDDIPFTRSAEQQSNLNTLVNTITFDNNGTNFDLENANYTAGLSTRFSGAVEIYYSRVANGNWVNYATASNWSTTGHQGAAASDYPKTGDIAIIGHTYIGGGTGRHQIQGPAGADITIASLIFDSKPNGTAFDVTDMSRLRIRGGRTLNVGTVSGTGEMVQDIGTVPQTATIIGDLGSFISDKNNGWFFWFQSAAAVTITDRFVYPVFRLFGAGGGASLTFSQDVTAHGAVIDNNTELRVTTNFKLDSLVQIGSNQDGSLSFRSTASNLTFECGSIAFSDDAGNSISVENAGTNIHRLIVNENIDLTVGARFDLTSASGSQVELEFAGSGNHSFINNTGVTADLYRLIINKGSSSSSGITISDNFTLAGNVASQPQALELQNGTLVLDDPAISIQLATNSEFDIPATAKLEVTQGTLTSTNSTIKLNGHLEINGGTVNLNSSDIEYSSTGSAIIELSSGVLNVGGQVRRSTSATTGVLKYRQTGGDVDIATDGASTSSRAAFEVLNPGSEFTLTGGTFNIARGVTGDANESLELEPETYDLTGSTISIFENLGSNYGSNYFNIKSSIPLNNLTIANTINMPDVRLYTQAIQLNDLTINTNQAFLANGFNTTIMGDITNNGSFTNSSAETIFGGSGSQNIDGGGTWVLYDLRKSGSGTTFQNVSLSINNNFYLTAGTFNIGSNSLSLKKDAYIQSTLSNSGGSGLIFNGLDNQNLYGLSNSTVSIGTLTISTSSGVDIPDGNGYNFDITQQLRLAGGVFNIGGSLVTLKPGATISEVAAFSVNNMVQTNSSFTDNGLKYEFSAIGSETTFLFPVGELKYTPVAFTLNSGTTAGSLRVRPANEPHPTIINDSETNPEPEINDLQNVLQYYWIVVADGFSNANGSATFYYNHSDIRVTSPYDSSKYIPARLLSNGVTWDKLAPSYFRGANQTFVFPISNFTFAEINGDYTAGVGSSDGTNNNIQGAIPDQLAQYETNLVGAGNFSSAANWNVLNGPAVSNGVGPVGAQIFIRNGDDISLDISNIRLYSTHIENGGIIRVPAGVTGIRLGAVIGNGTIVMQDTELLPTGDYTDFFACDGGAIQYSGTSTYSVLSGISQIRKVIFEGSGTRTMPNNDLSICDSLIINGPTVAFSSGRTRNIGNGDTDRLEIQAGVVTLSNGTILNVSGDFIVSGGSFTGTSGTRIEISDDVIYSSESLNWNGTTVLLDGSSSQDISGAFVSTSSFDNLQINNSSTTGVTITSGDMEVDGVLTLTDGLLNTTSTESLTITSTGSWTGATSESYVTGPITKNSIAAASTYQFPVGKSARYAPISVVNVATGGQNWTTEYFTATDPSYSSASFDATDPGSGFNSLTSVKSTDRWQMTSSGSNSSQIRLTYGSHDNFSFTENIRVVWWDGVDARWENQGGNLVVGTTISGTVTSENAIGFSTQQFALGNAPESILPVDLLFFEGFEKEGTIVLKWETATEINNAYFDLQHSLDGLNYSSIVSISGQGTTKTKHAYGFVHQSPVAGLNFYRLRQVDFDGTEEIFKAVVIDFKSGISKLEMNLYPNPSNGSDELTLNIKSEDNHTPLQIQCISLLGEIILKQVVDPSAGDIVIGIQDLPRGVYLILITQGTRSITKKLVID